MTITIYINRENVIQFHRYTARRIQHHSAFIPTVLHSGIHVHTHKHTQSRSHAIPHKHKRVHTQAKRLTQPILCLSLQYLQYFFVYVGTYIKKFTLGALLKWYEFYCTHYNKLGLYRSIPVRTQVVIY